MILLEVCAGSIQSAVEAQQGGAFRIELCDNLAQGGTTPSLSQITKSKQLIDIQINTLIRPREGDFLYSDLEFETMKQDIHYCGQTKCNGVVFGILNSDGSIDKKRNQELVEIAHQYGMEVTFHRAFDRSSNLYKALEDIIEIGCSRILTSGGKKTALEGKEIIQQLIEKAADKIIIMPGGGITEDNVKDLVNSTGLKEFHGSFRSRVRSKMTYMARAFCEEEEFVILQTDKEKVSKAIKNANNI